MTILNRLAIALFGLLMSAAIVGCAPEAETDSGELSSDALEAVDDVLVDEEYEDLDDEEYDDEEGEDDSDDDEDYEEGDDLDEEEGDDNSDEEYDDEDEA